MTALPFTRSLPKTGAEAVIPGNRSRKIPIPRAPIIYKMRNCRG
jgi:hypothetical protein